MLIDLHTHSTVSDGTFTPADVMAAAVTARLDVVALTDHDTTAGWAAAEAALPAGLTLVGGAELSCRWYDVVPPVGLHMLAYLFDPTCPPLVAEVTRVRATLAGRAERMVELLRADRVDVTWDQVRAVAAGDTVGWPHVARTLVERGVVETVAEAWGPDWLGDRYFVPKQGTDVFLALRMVHAAGGVAVVAHPGRNDRRVPDELLARLARAGLFGLEADHHEHSPAQRVRLRACAANFGLVATGSSDFHGAAKEVTLGADITADEVYERMVAVANGSTPVTSGPTASSGTRLPR